MYEKSEGKEEPKHVRGSGLLEGGQSRHIYFALSIRLTNTNGSFHLHRQAKLTLCSLSRR